MTGMKQHPKIMTPALAAALEAFRRAQKKMLASGLPMGGKGKPPASSSRAPKGGGKGAQGGSE